MTNQNDAANGVMTLPQCANADGNLPSCAPLANPYVPFQQTGPELYQAPCALIRGTLFPGLDLPYGGQENTQEKLATALTLMDAAAGGTYDWLLGPWPWEYGKER